MVLHRSADTELQQTTGTASLPGSKTIPLARHAVFTGALSPTDKVVICYLGLIALTAVIFAERVTVWPAFVAGHSLVIAIFLLSSKWSVRRKAQPEYSELHTTADSAVSTRGAAFFMRSWYALVLLPLTYKELTYLVPRVNPRDLDWELAAIDYAVFGVHPTVWLERITYPALTELLQICYISYYFLPLILGIPLWRRGRLQQFHLLLFMIVLGFYLSYIGYIAVPAIGPRFILKDEQSFPLEGIWFYQTLRTSLDLIEGITRDCFPSGHTALTLLVLYCAWRFHKPVFRFMLPVGTALIFSTVYLRYHYVIDVVAGIALAALVVLIAEPLYRLSGGRLPDESTSRSGSSA